MPRGASPEREKEYRELKHQFKEEGRYRGRKKEVAARIVTSRDRSTARRSGKEKKTSRASHPTGACQFAIISI